jgi:hypothetical protein
MSATHFQILRGQAGNFLLHAGDIWSDIEFAASAIHQAILGIEAHKLEFMVEIISGRCINVTQDLRVEKKCRPEVKPVTSCLFHIY